MKTLSRSCLTATVVLGFAFTGGQGADAAEAWRATGFKTPESVLFDPANRRLVVTNMNGGPGDVDGNGYLSLLSLDGKLLKADWTSGMDAPKGMAIAGGRLYVADVTKVRVVDLSSGALTATIDIPGSKFLNDVTSDADGYVYVTDMFANAIYRIKGTEAELWLKDDRLRTPNGILADGSRLIVGAWGTGLREDFSTREPGGLLAIDLESKAITPLPGAEAFGNVDGVVAADGAIYATDYLTGALYRYAGGRLEKAAALKPGSADIGTDGDTIYLPEMNEGEVVALKP